jgi:hypothetical protein
MRGSYLPLAWAPARQARIAAGRTVTGYRFAPDGTITATRRVRATTTTRFAVPRTARWNASRYAAASDGPLAGYWIPLSGLTFG